MGSASVGRASVDRDREANRDSTGRARVSVRPGFLDDDPDTPNKSFGLDLDDESDERDSSRQPGRRRRRADGDDDKRRPRSKQAKKRRRRRRIIALLSVALLMSGMLVLGGTYFFMSVPLPEDFPMPQASIILAADGETELARIGSTNRIAVSIDDIPDYMEQAVVTAEDRSFYTNEGVDLRGIARAAWNNLTSDSTQGASTITQQYIRNALDLTRERSYSRKAREIVLAIRLTQEYSKSQIMEFYLNTIYFGRGANGIEAAAQAYFDKHIKDVTLAEAALLAAVIRDPHGYDPAVNRDGVEERWRWVLNGMVEMGFVTRDQVANLQFPETIPPDSGGNDNGRTRPTGHILKYVEDELMAAGISDELLAQGGFVIQTTISPMHQQAAEEAIAQTLEGQPEGLTAALVAVEPGTGRVLAYYGGPDGTGWDNAGFNGNMSGGHPPGSSFKAFTLAAALEAGISIRSLWDGSSPQEFESRPGRPLRNSDNNNQCPVCTLEQSTVLSLNTTFYAVTETIGADRVIDLAHRAGIRYLHGEEGWINLDEVSPQEAARTVPNEVGFGQYSITVLDEASAFATFAANGVAANTHFVISATLEGEQIYTEQTETQQVIDEDVMADTTYVLQQVVENTDRELDGGRPAAGKTGTWEYGADPNENAHAWMAGYTPQVAASVWLGHQGDDAPLRDAEGRRIFGSGLPGEIWQRFMNTVHEGMEVIDFPDPVFLGDEDAGNIEESPTPSVEPSESSASPTPSEEPSETPDASPSAEPSDDSTQIWPPVDPSSLPPSRGPWPPWGGDNGNR